VSGVVDRNVWATVVKQILDDQCHGNRSEFARRVIIDGRPMSPRTVYGWLNGEADVKESSVRAVADAFGLNPVEMLIQVGFLTREQVPVYPDSVIDEEQRRVLESEDLDDQQKAYILAELDKMRATDEDLLHAQRERDRRRREERIDILIEGMRLRRAN
jgi:hypothetical protein